jgi:hypothetical protein
LGAFLVSFLALALVTVGFLPVGIGGHYDHWYTMESDIKSVLLIFTHSGSRISDPKTATKERGEKNLLSNLFL